MSSILEPIEIDILRSVQSKQTDVIREIYEEFLSSASEMTLWRRFDWLREHNYIRKNRRYALTSRGRRAIKKASI